MQCITTDLFIYFFSKKNFQQQSCNVLDIAMFDCSLDDTSIAHSERMIFKFFFLCYVRFYAEVVIAPSAAWRKETAEAEPPLLPKASVLCYILTKNRGLCGFTL